MFSFNKIKVFSIITAVFLLTPMLVSAGVYFMESIDEDAKEIAVTKPCILDYPKRSCPDGKVPQRLCPSDSRFFQDCGCDTDVYKYDASSCTDNKTPSGTTCDGKYAGCACDTTKYKYDSTNCTNGKALSGNTCDGKYDTCGCATEYSKTCPSPMIGGETACDGKYKSCKCPASYVTCDNGGDVGASQCMEENGTVKWSSCKAATCADGGFQSSVPVNQTCTQVPYNSLTCYENCRALTCADNNFVSSCPSGQTGTPVIYANLNCYKDCKDECAEYTKNSECYVCPKGDLEIAVTPCYPKVKDENYQCVYFPVNSECGLPANSALSCAPKYYTPSYNCDHITELPITEHPIPGCSWSYPAAVPNEGKCRKWSCGGGNTNSLDICVQRCSDPTWKDCSNCNPFECLQRLDACEVNNACEPIQSEI